MGLIKTVTCFNSEQNTISEYKMFMKKIKLYFLHTLSEAKKKCKNTFDMMNTLYNTYAVRISTKLTFNPKHTLLLFS